MSSEDEFYASYKYAWSEQSDSTLQDFLSKASLCNIQVASNLKGLLIIDCY